MVLLQFFTTTILLLSVISVKTYSVPYEDFQLGSSNIPELIYTESEIKPTLSGYSYATRDFNGGESNVVFTTNADSLSKLRNTINLMKMSEKYSQRDMLDKNKENLISLEQSKSEKVEEDMNKQEDINSNVEVLNEEEKISKNSEADTSFEYQTPYQQISFAHVPYPTLKTNLLNLQLPAVLPKYQVSSNVIQSQYYPHNSYASLELPLHNFNFYNPAVPLFYEETIPINSFEYVSTANKDMKESIEPYVTENLQINATKSESNSESIIIEAKSNLKSVINAVEETSSSQPATSINKIESITTSETIREEITSSESGNSAISTESSIAQTMDNEVSSTELTSTEGSPSSSTATSTKKCKC